MKKHFMIISVILMTALMASTVLGGESMGSEGAASPDIPAQENAVAAENSEAAEGTDDALMKKETGDSLDTFTTIDLQGNEFSEDIFEDYDYTMVNMWGTFCPPCIAEMPELQKLYESLPENIQIIGLISDLYYEDVDEATLKSAETIVDATGVKYTNLLIWDDALELVTKYTNVVPTTFFFDSEGNMVGTPIMGADIDAYKTRIAHLSGKDK